ncbi:MAG: hypothetical protein GWN30_38025 [Gammaproteobacteria bacterium]|nr:hypothetical protein [Phycisphaerae bacterium]NIW50367.1 hypothetical protein [Gammaproteobacteria bacterium]NIW99633.1 hypothetical protein [Phycisphaerae bacterium]
MSQISVDSVIPQSGTTITVGASGDTVNLGSGASTNGFLPSAIAVSGTDFQFDSGYGSTATAYGCRAWVNFNGTGTVAIRDSANISSLVDNGVGKYAVNFTTAMPDANYAVGASANETSDFGDRQLSATPTSSSLCDLYSGRTATTTTYDAAYVLAAFFR